MKIVEQWYKNWSVWLIGVTIGLAELAPMLPELQQNLPAEWYKYALIVILIARVLKQNNKV